jgi:Ni/Fe-hydrogenase 1 B-type cytochrome subunit
MVGTFESGPYRVTVGDAEPFAGQPGDLMALAAAGGRRGSDDPVDLALATAAKGAGHLEQRSWSAPSAARRYSVADLVDDRTGERLQVARGDLQSILALSGTGAETRTRAERALRTLVAKGYVPVGLAVALADGAWQYAGTVPVRVTRRNQTVRDTPADFRYVHVWDWGLRLLHWTWVLLIALLAVTGLMIWQAWIFKTGDLTNGFTFGYLRLVHYTAGALFGAVLLLRIWALFTSTTKYGRWQALFPFSWQRTKDALITAKHYLLMSSWESPRYVGHNPLQQWTYTGVLGLFFFMLVTGFAVFSLYEPRNPFFVPFMHLNYWFGAATVRFAHTVGMWLLLVFIPAHIYLSLLSGNVDREGTISSMISGGRWLRKGVRFEDE